MRRIIKLVLGFLLLVVFIFFLAVSFYKVFEKRAPLISNLEISYSTSKQDVDTDSSNQSFSTATSYRVSIRNKGDESSKFQLIVNDNSAALDGIRREHLKYQLFLNGEKLKESTMDEISDNVLDERVIEGGEYNQYVFKVVLDNDANNIKEDYYYSLKVVPIF